MKFMALSAHERYNSADHIGDMINDNSAEAIIINDYKRAGNSLYVMWQMEAHLIMMIAHARVPVHWHLCVP